MQMIARVDIRVERLMVLAHNPGISSLASTLAQKDLSMPTAATVLLGYDSVDWSPIRLSSALELVDFMRPKSLPKNDHHENDGGDLS